MANAKDLKAVTDIVDDESIYNVADVVKGEGGDIKNRPADVKKKVDQKADTVKESEEMDDEDEMEDEDEEEMMDVKESFASLFEGTNLSSEFKQRASLVFEAAVNEAATEKAKEITSSLEEDFEAKLVESVNESMDQIVENLDSYLDYIVSEWMEENSIAIESGVKVQMAESFMESLKELFSEHNVEITEETVDVVAGLETQLSESTGKVNKVINKNIELVEEINALKAEKVFNEICEGLATSQKERMRVLSEKLDNSDLDSFKTDLGTLKESFFKSKPVITEDITEEQEELITEDTTKKRVSDYDSVNYIVNAINARNSK
jgi:hypothetical protein